MTDIAERAGVKLATVSGWLRKRTISANITRHAEAVIAEIEAGTWRRAR